ncbi:hypothetical protein [Terracoccus luteus]|uniref:Uncharacterized protein n=1 Tax=Terracoccus luteus TaxID=53356 RepID=A0A839PWM7_9MICO|nr:hypothetical protein [Terracoccus luteus]MBB2987483.1 hypothetical protein [Terracoccus luteus]MCP2173134.1 hypothetical protein [Terracoccus luteus]
MNAMHIDPSFVRLEIEARYGRPRGHARRDSSLEVLRRTMRRNALRELRPGTR